MIALASRLKYLNSSFVQIILISAALYIRWSCPVKIWLTLYFLVPSLLLYGSTIFFKSNSISGLYLFPEYKVKMKKVHYCWTFVLFLFCPVMFGLLGLWDWPFIIYIVICSVLLMKLYKKESSFTFNASLWFNIVFIYVGYLLLFVWPYISSHCIQLPFFISKLVAWQQNFFNNGWAGIDFGSLSSGIFKNSQSIITRGNAVGLQGNLVEPAVFVLTTEQLHVLAFIFLFAGSILRTVFFIKSRVVLSLCIDVLALLLSFYFYISILWLDILEYGQSPIMFPIRIWCVICISMIWFVTRVLLQFVADAVFRKRDNEASPHVLTFQIPSLKNTLIPCVLLSISVLFLLLDDPGHLKAGNIIIDEHHSKWEKSDLPMTPDIYGVKTVYNYNFMKSIFEQHYNSVVVNYERLNTNILDKCDVLILKTPTKAYSQEEIKAVVEFVEKGGGLWLIGEHTNIFGINTYLNQIGSTWKLYFNSNAVLPLDRYYQDNVRVKNVPERHKKCGKKNHEVIHSTKYLNHPVISHNIPYAAILTSCSVSAPLFCEYISKPCGVYMDDARFGGNTFFGNMQYDEDDYYGCILQNAALKVGKGRVAMWSDSTIFSNFSMCMSGVPELALGYLSWLNRVNTISSTVYNWILLILTVICLGACFLFAKDVYSVFCIYIVTFTIVLAAVPLIDQINSTSYPSIDITKGFTSVGFDQEYSEIELPNKDHCHNGDPEAFESFYIMMQRYNAMPISSDYFKDVLKEDMAVVINPLINMKQSDMELLKRTLTNGKHLLMMINNIHRKDNMEAIVARANQILEYLKVPERFTVVEKNKYVDIYGEMIGNSLLTDVPVGTFIDNEDKNTKILLMSSANDPLVIKRGYGKGGILLCSIAELYNDSYLCENSAVPNPKQHKVLKSIYKLMSCGVPLYVDETNNQTWESIINKDELND